MLNIKNEIKVKKNIFRLAGVTSWGNNIEDHKVNKQSYKFSIINGEETIDNSLIEKVKIEVDKEQDIINYKVNETYYLKPFIKFEIEKKIFEKIIGPNFRKRLNYKYCSRIIEVQPKTLNKTNIISKPKFHIYKNCRSLKIIIVPLQNLYGDGCGGVSINNYIIDDINKKFLVYLDGLENMVTYLNWKADTILYFLEVHIALIKRRGRKKKIF
jgi:hypothetical protein